MCHVMFLQHDMRAQSELKAFLGVAISSLYSLDLSSFAQLSAGRISVSQCGISHPVISVHRNLR
jgi:hypothetical protein